MREKICEILDVVIIPREQYDGLVAARTLLETTNAIYGSWVTSLNAKLADQNKALSTKIDQQAAIIRQDQQALLMSDRTIGKLEALLKAKTVCNANTQTDPGYFSMWSSQGNTTTASLEAFVTEVKQQ